MKKILMVLCTLVLLSGCYSNDIGYYFKTAFCNTPNTYEKEIIDGACGSTIVRLKLEDHVWDQQELPELINRMVKTVYKEKLYINKLLVRTNARRNPSVIIFASNIPTYLADKREKQRHDYLKIREKPCDCRLCK